MKVRRGHCKQKPASGVSHVRRWPIVAASVMHYRCFRNKRPSASAEPGSPPSPPTQSWRAQRHWAVESVFEINAHFRSPGRGGACGPTLNWGAGGVAVESPSWAGWAFISKTPVTRPISTPYAGPGGPMLIFFPGNVDHFGARGPESCPAPGRPFRAFRAGHPPNVTT